MHFILSSSKPDGIAAAELVHRNQNRLAEFNAEFRAVDKFKLTIKSWAETVLSGRGNRALLDELKGPAATPDEEVARVSEEVRSTRTGASHHLIRTVTNKDKFLRGNLSETVAALEEAKRDNVVTADEKADTHRHAVYTGSYRRSYDKVKETVSEGIGDGFAIAAGFGAGALTSGALLPMAVGGVLGAIAKPAGRKLGDGESYELSNILPDGQEGFAIGMSMAKVTAKVRPEEAGRFFAPGTPRTLVNSSVEEVLKRFLK